MNTVFRRKNTSLAEAAVTALEAEQPMTLRQLFYRLISSGHLRNADQEYRRLGAVMTVLRERRIVPRNWMVDHIRATLKPSSWTGLADFAETVRNAYRKDFWASLPNYVEVFCEKDAIASTLHTVTREYDVPLRVLRGFSSISFAGEIADEWAQVKKPIFAYYVGDFDPSGFEIERDITDKLWRYSNREFEWQRLGVVADDFEELQLIRLPVKRNDTRAARFQSQYGEHCAEVDAIPPAILRERVRTAIESHIASSAWTRLLAVEAIERESLDEFAGRIARLSTKPDLDQVSEVAR